MATQTDIRVLIPRVRRAVQGVTPDMSVTDDMLRDVVADSLSAIMLYTGSVFGHGLIVTDRANGVPTEYATTDELSLAEQHVVAAQSALDYFFHQFNSVKLSETIANEAQNWTYTRSAQLLRDQFQHLRDERDKALAALGAGTSLVHYESFLAVRDMEVARAVEPFAPGLLPQGGLEADFRFGTIG